MTKHWTSDRVGKAKKCPALVCGPCARKNGGHWPDGHLASVGTGICGWCGELKTVTEPRDWGYPRYKAKRGSR